MFKTARFKIHNPSRHKATMLWYALTHYHKALKAVLESTLAIPTLLLQVSEPDKKGKLRPNKFSVAKLIRKHSPQNWELAPIRDYLIADATAMIMSHLAKVYKGANESNIPTLPDLAPITDDEYRMYYSEFTDIGFQPNLKSQHIDKIEKARKENQPNVAARLEKIYTNWAITKTASQLLIKLDARQPHPIEFTHTEFTRGAMLTQKDGRYFLMTRLFSQDHRYTAKKKLDDGFINCKTGESLNGKTYPGLILPLELGRAYHEDEYFKFGKIQSAKLLAKETNGIKEFFIHAAFEFSPEIIETKTIIGLDRGAARIGTGTLIDMEGHCLKTGIHLDGDRFRLEMDNHQKRIQLMQKRGIQRSRRFSVRGKRSDIILGEFANQLINLALEHQSQIIIEAIKGTTMGKFLKQSQFTRLKDLLTYKAQRVGLPDPIEVPAAYTSQTCSKCGYKDPLNRPKKDEKGKPLQDRFLCLRCGFKENADTNASHIIALRGLHQLQMGGRYQKFSTFEMWLKNHIGLDNEKLDTFHQ